MARTPSTSGSGISRAVPSGSHRYPVWSPLARTELLVTMPRMVPSSSMSKAVLSVVPAGTLSFTGVAVGESQRAAADSMPLPRPPTITPASLIASAWPAPPRSRLSLPPTYA